MIATETSADRRTAYHGASVLPLLADPRLQCGVDIESSLRSFLPPPHIQTSYGYAYIDQTSQNNRTHHLAGPDDFNVLFVGAGNIMFGAYTYTAAAGLSY